MKKRELYFVLWGIPNTYHSARHTGRAHCIFTELMNVSHGKDGGRVKAKLHSNRVLKAL